VKQPRGSFNQESPESATSMARVRLNEKLKRAKERVETLSGELGKQKMRLAAHKAKRQAAKAALDAVKNATPDEFASIKKCEEAWRRWNGLVLETAADIKATTREREARQQDVEDFEEARAELVVPQHQDHDQGQDHHAAAHPGQQQYDEDDGPEPPESDGDFEPSTDDSDSDSDGDGADDHYFPPLDPKPLPNSAVPPPAPAVPSLGHLPPAAGPSTVHGGEGAPLSPREKELRDMEDELESVGSHNQQVFSPTHSTSSHSSSSSTVVANKLNALNVQESGLQPPQQAELAPMTDTDAGANGVAAPSFQAPAPAKRWGRAATSNTSDLVRVLTV
jgi:hypothetical protein